MYLVHATLRPLAPDGSLPRDVRDLLLAAIRPEDRVEHLVVHPDAVPRPVLGVYLLADSLAEAEHRAAAFCRRALAGTPRLSGWRTAGVAVPLVTPFYERLLFGADGADGARRPAGPGRPEGPRDTDGKDRPGLNGPGTLPSSRDLFHPP
ncbi:hypothetical protein [Kitasatospora sp. NPDC059327]|uniref:hypothetical protein n=1 Tax=Kitasatospora sp. NPDC059327 TaxID=3346803 RepID=UPI003681E6E4